MEQIQGVRVSVDTNEIANAAYRFGSSTRPSKIVLQWFVKNGVSSLSVLLHLYAGACQEP